ncbi:prephenate dehydratase [Aliikangiella marina]|uniref:Bifunctional chorismate mutase/prephenate dehydratase n=1 Tax=Aliikangiella marina TaxID=1712262 RepID=A0A545TH48_9GAMM|nr:prephenate dehydratase [Aliikangiella marina]TQV76552.1 prephenate dehydratase [Aliikangiella marina]
MTEKPAPKSHTKEFSDIQKLSLAEIRQGITEIDDQLIDLLAKRRDFSRSVAINKLGDFKPVRDQQREKELLDILIAKGAAKGLAPHYITRLFHTIIEDSVILQGQFLQNHSNPGLLDGGNKTVAVLGGKGAYSYLAAQKYFDGQQATYEAFDSFEGILNSVQSGENEFGVLPIENTTSGGITEVYDLLLHSELSIIGEVSQSINHCLLGQKTTTLETVKQVIAHPEARKQCHHWLGKQQGISVKLSSSTAEALRLAADDTSGTIAAIGGEQSADAFGLKVITRDITNLAENATRFLVVTKKPQIVSPQVACKTSVIISTGQKPGSLAEVLLVFRDARLPLTKLESRPIVGKPWEQMFYIDFEGNIDDPTVIQSLEDIRDICNFIKILGSYPAEQIKPTRVSPTEYYRGQD